MDETSLYRRIAAEIRREILEGQLKPGDRLPAMRKLTQRWNCAPGTVQRAYAELAQQGLLVSRAGRGTVVAGEMDPAPLRAQEPLRRAGLVHRAEGFLLESLAAGHSPAEVRQALELALERWRSQPDSPVVKPLEQRLRFSGSHDAAVAWLANHAAEALPEVEFQVSFSGSLGGLMALAEGRADLAGSHLWDPESNRYNLPFVRRLFPGLKMALVRLADRRLGWILPPGNPRGISRLEDIARPGLRFINRQRGSGTRVWLDEALARLAIAPEAIAGYSEEKTTHTDAARAVAEGRADLALGLESAAVDFGLDFVFLVEESYDFVVPAAALETPPLRALLNWLASPAGRRQIGSLAGYDTRQSGAIQPI